MIINCAPIVVEDKKIQSVSNATNFYFVDYSNDRELQIEINKLIIESINLNTSKTITVQYHNQLILIPVYVPISSRLSSLFWTASLMYESHELPFAEHYNRFLMNAQTNMVDNKYPDGIDISQTVAIFGATYKKNMVAINTDVMANKQDDDGFKRCNTGIYRYYDFALLIVKNGQVVDYAIHGHISNISEAINQHNPQRVYYNAAFDDALDIFLRYPYQPFYAATHNKLAPMRTTIINDINPLPFCERRAPFCALCNCLKYLRSLMFTTKSAVSQVDNWPQLTRKHNIFRNSRFKGAPFKKNATRDNRSRQLFSQRSQQRLSNCIRIVPT